MTIQGAFSQLIVKTNSNPKFDMDETSSVTSKELAGKLPIVRSLLRKSLVSLTKDGSYELKVEGDSQRNETSVPWDGC